MLPTRRSPGRFRATLARVCVTTVALATTSVSLAGVSNAVAAPAESTDSSAIVATERVSARELNLSVYSAAMQRNIPLSVITPRDASKPAGVLYLLNGAGGGEDSATWKAQTDAVKFFADKQVWVVTPNVGKFSYYTDWQTDDPKLGRMKWSTFLGTELPAALDSAFRTTGKRAVAGISTSATSALNLAIDNPGKYGAVGAYSGCPQSNSDLGKFYIKLVVEARGGTTMTNMWGPLNGPGWRANDPMTNASKLRGTKVYLSAASGLPGAYDNVAYVRNVTRLGDQIAVGGALEAMSNVCTAQFADRLRQVNIPATTNFVPAGTHSWRYWQDQLHRSWPTIAAGLATQ